MPGANISSVIIINHKSDLILLKTFAIPFTYFLNYFRTQELSLVYRFVLVLSLYLDLG